MTSDSQLRKLALLRQHIQRYLEVSSALAAAGDRASQASLGQDSEARRRVYGELRDLGAAARLAERRMTKAARDLNALLPLAEIEKLAQSMDKRDTPDSPLVIIRAALNPT